MWCSGALSIEDAKRTPSLRRKSQVKKNPRARRWRACVVAVVVLSMDSHRDACGCRVGASLPKTLSVHRTLPSALLRCRDEVHVYHRRALLTRARTHQFLCMHLREYPPLHLLPPLSSLFAYNPMMVSQPENV